MDRELSGPEDDPRPVEDRPSARGDGEVTSELPLGARVFFFMYVGSVYPPQAFGLVGSTITRAEVEVHFFFTPFVFLVSDRHALVLPAALFPPHRALNMNGIRGVLAGVTTNDLYQDCDLRLWGTLWCSAKYLLIAKDWAGRTWREDTWKTGRIRKPLLCFSRPLFFFFHRGTEGQTCLFGLICKGGARSSKTGVGKGTERRVVYYVRIVV